MIGTAPDERLGDLKGTGEEDAELEAQRFPESPGNHILPAMLVSVYIAAVLLRRKMKTPEKL